VRLVFDWIDIPLSFFRDYLAGNVTDDIPSAARFHGTPMSTTLSHWQSAF
jgi:hypothetical protein